MTEADSAVGEIIGEFAKNATETVIVRLVPYHGVETVDVRAWADYSDSGERKPTKKGIAIRVALLPELIALLRKAEIEARRRGLLKVEEIAA